MLQSLMSLGRFGEAAVYAAEALRLAEATHHAYTIGMVGLVVSYFHAGRDDWVRARAEIERAIAAWRSENLRHGLSEAVALSAVLLARVGEPSEALARLRESQQLLDADTAMGYLSFHRHAYRSLGRAALLLGRVEEAQTLADRALEHAPPQPASVASTSHLVGDIAAHPDRFDAQRSEAHYRQALTLAVARGMRPLIAHCHGGLGSLYRRLGKADDASAHLTIATTMYRQMGMTYSLDKAEAELHAL
jgi:tetratricopeptide (TPR) repeat protein